ncbi:MAG: radical SAM protein [Methanocellales archaeon]|nr:radical SAM protein [Methanocellales archaeon]MDD3292363.1 radical SAM protein [Methanocellales archaeon]MDD5235621.1 radical SAM protein [Methanocellales archaeon]MDD5485732.1 radical SAM protein [Methanocellales archaeon]
MIVKEVYAKTILSKSKVLDYAINPYIGCEHGCTYCYARFMKKFTSHNEEDWGGFVDVKINATGLLQREVKKKRVGKVWISGVCDPYQPLERKYELTKRCLEILLKRGWPVTIQTKSPLVLRDSELLREFDEIEVGLTITTADENIRKIFEPKAPPIKQRIETLEKLHSAGIRVFAMIAPILPKAEVLVEQLSEKVDYVLIDKMNYHYADRIYKSNELEYAMHHTFFTQKKAELSEAFKKEGIPCQLLF